MLEKPVLIILSNEMDVDGNLNIHSTARIRLAAELYKTREAKAILTCGWAYRNDTLLTLSEAFRNHILKEYPQIPKDLILCEKFSRDTVGDAIFSKKYFAIPNKWKKIIVITSQFHIKRASEIFNFVYGQNFQLEFQGCQLNSDNGRADKENESLSSFRNTFEHIESGHDTKIFHRLLEKHPYYNGEKLPKIVLV
jgi:vancomycin permeability regulator SanA